MRRTALYSRSTPRPAVPTEVDPPVQEAVAEAPEAAARPARHQRAGAFARHPGTLWAAIAALALALALPDTPWRAPAQRKLTQDDINAAVMHTLTQKTLPSQAARAAAAVGPSLVRVEGEIGRAHV